MVAFVAAPGTSLSQLGSSSFSNGTASARRPRLVHTQALSRPRHGLAPTSSRTRTTIAATAANPATSSTSNPASDKLVDEILKLVKDTNSGKTVTEEKGQVIANHVGQLLRYNQNRPLLEDARIFDNYAVAYSRSRQTGEPAGGLFRSKIGGLIFITRGLFQHVVKPDVIVNAVSFRFLGIISGVVVLKGKIESLKDQEPGLGPNAIAVDFEKPRIKIGPATFQYGPLTRVRLTLCHLDDRVRLAIGRRGTVLVFTRCEKDTPHVDDWKAAVDAKPLPTILLPLAAVGILVFACFAPLLIRLLVLAVVVGAFVVLKNGGNQDNADAYRDRVLKKSGQT